ncbi:50S ribosome-binding GTPase [Paraburkholderia susongensis]|uniref:50S ribosome-binding GTPase n=1 Tax=Paraburkholderia susongensis TaxID=1515439 RepID=A0A1X7KPB3_9BURK|nr:50S ribosome-binding GTPase [Paraburkholderia susongensis]
MKADVSNELRFIAEVDAFEFGERDIGQILHSLDAWLAKLDADLQSNLLACTGLKEQSALAAQADAINTVLRKSPQAWSRQWANLESAQTLADSFDDKALLLVFGKFNAGKSSFCNFLADRFVAHGKSAQYFHVEAGSVVETSERFREGATETTSRLQGVRLGEKLVLLDTPGLHSVTPDNAALTQRFIDSADAVIWLTSSTSPGQVQELDELGRELHRNKPLLPVVTRSDMYEEDEVDGEIVKLLCNKTVQGRAQQEADVEARAKEKLVAMGVDAALLKRPVSISAYMAREQRQTQAAMVEAGFERLYAALLSIAEPSLAYKRRKRAEILLHHLEENVLGHLCGEVLPLFAGLRASSQAALDLLERQREQTVNAVWRSVLPTLPALLEKHAAQRDVQAICDSLSRSIHETFSREANEQFADYVIAIEAALAEISFDDKADFESIALTHPEADVREIVGVDYQQLHAALKQAIHANLSRLSSDAGKQCHASIEQLMELAERLKNVLSLHAQDLSGLKSELRAESG